MAKFKPSWFDAELIFQTPDGWFIGSRKGFRVGPYPDQNNAKKASLEISARLSRAKDKGDMVRIVRTFLNEQSGAAKHGEDDNIVPIHGTVDVPVVRDGEDKKVWFRTSRFFNVGDAWFFHTRENINVGPYESREVAEEDARKLLKLLAGMESEQERNLTIHQFRHRPVVYRRRA